MNCAVCHGSGYVSSPSGARYAHVCPSCAELRWSVVGVNDDGRTFVVNSGMCYATAEQLAGVMRDLSTDAEIADGWNYLARIGPKTQKHLDRGWKNIGCGASDTPLRARETRRAGATAHPR